jgi:adenine deaminase
MNFSFCTDDRHPASLIEEGHIDNNLRLAIKSGLDPVTAFQIGTISTAVFYGLKDAGAVAPGYFADFFTFDDIASPRAQKVFKRGVLVAEGGKSLFDAKDVDRSWMKGTMRVAPLDMDSFRIKAGGARIRVIVVVPGQIVTRAVVEDAVIAGGETVADVNRDLLKFAVIERHRASGRMGLGFVKGFGLKRGALASSVAHDSHNLGVLGTNDGDMLKAAETVISMGGGQALVAGGEVKAALPLPVAGLVSEKPLEVVAGEIRALHDAAAAAGCSIPDPFAVMSFLPLVPIPELRLTDMGLVDATKFQYTELFVK